jgi:hypothetical protein
MSRVYDRLKEAERIRRNLAQPQLGHRSIREVLKGLTKEQQEEIRNTLLADLLARRPALRVKVKCPQCKEDISLRFRLKLRSHQKKTSTEEATRPYG